MLNPVCCILWGIVSAKKTLLPSFAGATSSRDEPCLNMLEMASTEADPGIFD